MIDHGCEFEEQATTVAYDVTTDVFDRRVKEKYGL